MRVEEVEAKAFCQYVNCLNSDCGTLPFSGQVSVVEYEGQNGVLILDFEQI